MRGKRYLAALATFCLALSLQPTDGVAVTTGVAAGVAGECVGDCTSDFTVSVSDLILGVNILLGATPVDACPSLDVNADNTVGVNELITAVNNALTGCEPTPPAPTDTPPLTMGTPTPLPPTFTATPVSTPTSAPGPMVVFFGMLSANDALVEPTAIDSDGIPIYTPNFGAFFTLVVEGVRGASNAAVGPLTFAVVDAPDLQIQANRDLGANPTTAVCDGGPPDFGGVPGIDPPRFDDTQFVRDALNDLGCRFVDGFGASQGRGCAVGCVRFETGEFDCVAPNAQLQFCGPIAKPSEFPPGDTLVTVRLRDVSGNLGPPAQLIIRVGPVQ